MSNEHAKHANKDQTILNFVPKPASLRSDINPNANLPLGAEKFSIVVRVASYQSSESSRTSKS